MTSPTTNLNIDIFLVIRNQADMLKYFLEHYTTNLPGCRITVFDNNSSDRTIQVALSKGCVIHHFPKYTEEELQEFKNNIWKGSKADWVIVCDADELFQITMEDLLVLPSEVNALKSEGYQMISPSKEIIPYRDLTHGYRLDRYDKLFMFKPTLKEVNYTIGAHECSPTPDPIYGEKTYKMFHYKDAWIRPMWNHKHKPCVSAWKLLNEMYLKNLKKAVKLK